MLNIIIRIILIVVLLFLCLQLPHFIGDNFYNLLKKIVPEPEYKWRLKSFVPSIFKWGGRQIALGSLKIAEPFVKLGTELLKFSVFVLLMLLVLARPSRLRNIWTILLIIGAGLILYFWAYPNMIHQFVTNPEATGKEQVQFGWSFIKKVVNSPFSDQTDYFFGSVIVVITLFLVLLARILNNFKPGVGTGLIFILLSICTTIFILIPDPDGTDIIDALSGVVSFIMGLTLFVDSFLTTKKLRKQ